MQLNIHSLCLALLQGCAFSVSAVSALNPQTAWQNNAKPTASETQNFMPRFSENTIVCGNKNVRALPFGKVVISNEGSDLLSFEPHFVYENARGVVDWHTFTQECCSVRKIDGKIVWDLKKKLDGKLYTAAEQTMEITPDGLLKIHTQFKTIPVPGWTPRNPVGTAFLIVPIARAERKDMIFNEKRYKMSPSVRTVCYSDKFTECSFTYYPDQIADTVTVFAKKPELGNAIACFPVSSMNIFRTDLVMNPQNSITLFFDIRKGVTVVQSPDMQGGIDFKAVENLELPDYSHKNLLQNGSFERGKEGWRVRFNGNYWEGKWDWNPFEVVSGDARFGKYALQLDALSHMQEDYRRLTYSVNLTSSVIAAAPGCYTLSFYAKGPENVRSMVSLWIPKYLSGSSYTSLTKETMKMFQLTSEWKRYEFSFQIPQSQPVEVCINGTVYGKERGKILMDAIQFEKGSKATAYETVPAEGKLCTSEQDNYISADSKIQGELEITTAKPEQSGNADIRVKNFFDEVLLQKSFPFKSGKDCKAVLALPLDQLPGLGIFMLRADYTLADGTKAFDHHRYAKVRFMDNTHRNKNTFAVDFAYPERNFNYHQILSRWKKMGVGARYHHLSFEKAPMEQEQDYGIYPGNCFMVSYLRDKDNNICGFALIDNNKPESYLSPDDHRILIRDFHYDSDGTITPEYLEKFKDAVKKIVSKNKHVPMWCFGGEFIAHLPGNWWGKNLTEKDIARMHAMLLKAFAEGVREANPKAKVFQDDPCNMRPEGGLKETDLLLAECSKIGVKFDVIGIHPYRFSPESPDLDSDAALLFKIMDKHGYTKSNAFWPEMMLWGPFTIPQWDVECSNWGGNPKCWLGGIISYDMGWNERKAAAWYMRSWLVALKYQKRLLGATSGFGHGMDLILTPWAYHLVPNTLSNILGNAEFKADIRFAPYIRAFVFEDEQKRPIAAVWCHLDKLDNGQVNAPIAEADFGNCMESILDFMNTDRSFRAGEFQFPVSSFPIFLRGKPGTLKQMTAALEKARIISGSQGVAPLELLANPYSGSELGIAVRNLLSRPFSGTINKQKLDIPAFGKTVIPMTVDKKISADAITRVQLPLTIKAQDGAEYKYDFDLETLMAKKISDKALFNTVDWLQLPQVSFIHGCSAKFRIGWNSFGLFIEVQTPNKFFTHIEYPKTGLRHKNDCLQIYFDTMANAKIRETKGYDEDDYEYAVFPNSKGDSSIVWRMRMVEEQLGLATQAPKPDTEATTIPSSFQHENGVSTYRVFFPANDLLPMKLHKGTVFGLGLLVLDADQPGKVVRLATTSSDNQGCYNKPHLWPSVLLVE